MMHHLANVHYLTGPAGIIEAYLPAPQVCLPIASLLVDGISSNLAHIFSSPGKIF